MITKRKTRGIAKRLTMLKAGEEYWLGVDAEDHAQQLKALGFSLPLSPGERLLPLEKGGPACRRNASGGVIIHRDRPKETVYRQLEWHWVEFRGRYGREERSEIVDVPYQRYPRTPIPPHGVEIAIRADAKGTLYAVAGPFAFDPAHEARATNTLNLFIELFGECAILTSDMTAWMKAPVKQLNWQLLPPGKNPWMSAKPALERVVDSAKTGNQPVIRARFETIGEHDPAFVAIGKGGFDGYVVFGFPDLKLCILECRLVNNATYVLNEDSWETISMLTKAEILNGKLHRMRLVHREKWFSDIRALLALPKQPVPLRTPVNPTLVSSSSASAPAP